jgi:DNA-directed RNA polymerase subunit alpha
LNEPIFEINKEKEDPDYGKFIITPMPQGYGDTIGNSLRRVLLSSLKGAAITSVKMSGVKHQFTSLKGMKEDVVDFILNLKKVRVFSDQDKTVSAEISAKGPGEVRAKDIKTSSGIKIANPDLLLATLNKDMKLDAKLEIQIGVGYSSSEDRKTGEVGVIPLDATFSPVTRVNYKVEETRVGRLTNFDKLILEIWTDGSVKPGDALLEAAKILSSYFSQIINPKKIEKEVIKKDEGIGPIGRLSVEEIGLPTRVANALVRAGFETVEDLSKAKSENLVKVRNLGEKSIKIINAALVERDLEPIK